MLGLWLVTFGTAEAEEPPAPRMDVVLEELTTQNQHLSPTARTHSEPHVSETRREEESTYVRVRVAVSAAF
jgi:hypothetical protein